MKYLTNNGLMIVTKNCGETQNSLNQRVKFILNDLKQYKFNQLSSRILNDLDGKSKRNVAIKDLECKYF